MRAEIARAAEGIREDRGRGARELALEALAALAAIAPTANEDELRAAAQALAQARPSMAAIENAVAQAWQRYRESGNGPEAVRATIQELERSAGRLVEAARNALPTGTIITLSYSSTVLEALRRLQPARVIVAESRPLNEGVKAAEALAASGIHVTLITDAQVGLFVRQAEAAVVGADAIRPDGSFVNKAGTRLLALAAREAKVPLYVVSETMKAGAAREPAEEGDPREVYPDEGLDVRNVYFEEVPARVVTAYITEHGLARPSEMRRYARRAQELLRDLMATN